jgi:hypothetical protein
LAAQKRKVLAPGGQGSGTRVQVNFHLTVNRKKLSNLVPCLPLYVLNRGWQKEKRDMSATYSISIPQWLDRVFTCPLMIYRRLKYGYTFRRINLGDGVYTIVDVDIFYRLGHHKWHLKGSNAKKFYVVRDVKIGPGKTKMLSLHREIMNQPKGLLVDHMKGNSLDNRRAVLRVATWGQNAQNRPKKQNTSSRFKGVSFHKRYKKYGATICIKGKNMLLGWFENEIDAAKAYDAAARKYYGPHAKVNFPDELKSPLVKSD